MPKLLRFVPKSSHILRNKLPNLENIQSLEIQELIDSMIYSIRPAQLAAAKAIFTSAAGMAANQWGLDKRIFIFTPEGSGEENRTEAIINPSYVPIANPQTQKIETESMIEGCFSIPLTAGEIRRFTHIKVNYQTRQGIPVEKILQGWDARVFQHETDHLDGKLYDGKLDGFDGPECLMRKGFKDKSEMEVWYEQMRIERQKIITYGNK
ncbi:MAG: def [Francisellaceae bacterium]|nr:def [Francisellaceae bacterium]